MVQPIFGLNSGNVKNGQGGDLSFRGVGAVHDLVVFRP